jgi:hypothetical protein
MTKHTDRDLVWHHALQRAKSEESFYLDDIAQVDEIDSSKRTIRDTLKTLVDTGWLAKDSPRAHEWQPGPLVLGEEIETSDDTESSEDADPNFTDAMSLDHIENATDFEEGEVYFGTVDRFSDYGDGLIEIPTSHINVGPIDNSANGETIRFKFVGGTYGLCLDDQYTHPEYSVPGQENSGPSESSNTSTSSSTKGSASSEGSGPSRQQSTSAVEEPNLPTKPKDSDHTFVYYVASSKANCYHSTRGCPALDKREGDLVCAEKELGGEIPDEISHLRPCMKC